MSSWRHDQSVPGSRSTFLWCFTSPRDDRSWPGHVLNTSPSLWVLGARPSAWCRWNPTPTIDKLEPGPGTDYTLHITHYTLHITHYTTVSPNMYTVSSSCVSLRLWRPLGKLATSTHWPDPGVRISVLQHQTTLDNFGQLWTTLGNFRQLRTTLDNFWQL